jgi:hypothetical protein
MKPLAYAAPPSHLYTSAPKHSNVTYTINVL